MTILFTKETTMIKPETLDFFGNELDKAKLEIVSYWKDKYDRTKEQLVLKCNQLEIAVDALKSAQQYICSDKKSYQIIQTALEKITALEQKDVK